MILYLKNLQGWCVFDNEKSPCIKQVLDLTEIKPEMSMEIKKESCHLTVMIFICCIQQLEINSCVLTYWPVRISQKWFWTKTPLMPIKVIKHKHNIFPHFLLSKFLLWPLFMYLFLHLLGRVCTPAVWSSELFLSLIRIVTVCCIQSIIMIFCLVPFPVCM